MTKYSVASFGCFLGDGPDLELEAIRVIDSHLCRGYKWFTLSPQRLIDDIWPLVYSAKMAATVRQVIVASEELEQYARVLAESFDYSFFGSALNRDKALQGPMMHAHMAAALVTGEGEVHVAELPGEGVVGITVWFGPGHVYLDSDAQRNAGHNQVVEKLPVELQKWWTQFLDEYANLTDRVLGPGVKLGGYHLQLIGVSPAHQRKGVASALMKYAETKAHAARVPCTVETVGKTNTTIYKAMGYLVAGTGPLTVTPPSTGTFEMVVFIKHTESETVV